MSYPRPTAVRRYIYGRLSTDAVLNGNPTNKPKAIPSMLGGTAAGYRRAIYYGNAPEDASYPFVLFSKSSGLENEGLSGTFDTFGNPGGTAAPSSLHQNDVWMVKVMDHSTTADAAEAAADRIRDQLVDYVGGSSMSGGTCAVLSHVSDINYPEVVDGEMFWHVGANYRVITHFP